MRRSFRRKFLGLASSGRVNEVDLVDESQIEALNKSHKNVVLGLVGVLALLMVVGIVDDFASDTPIGQTSGLVTTTTEAPPKKPR